MLGRYLPILLTILSEHERSIVEIGAESERLHDGSLKASSRNLLELMGEVGAALQTDIGNTIVSGKSICTTPASRGHRELQRFMRKESSSLI